MASPLVSPPKASPGDRVAVFSPSYAAPGAAPAVHEQGLRRLRELTGLEPVEYPTTRRLDATARDRAADLNAAFADPAIRAVLATIGGEDQTTVVPHLDPAPLRSDPRLFLGYSDNTNLLTWLWDHGGARLLRRVDPGAARPRAGRRRGARGVVACGDADRGAAGGH